MWKSEAHVNFLESLEFSENFLYFSHEEPFYQCSKILITQCFLKRSAYQDCCLFHRKEKVLLIFNYTCIKKCIFFIIVLICILIVSRIPLSPHKQVTHFIPCLFSLPVYFIERISLLLFLAYLSFFPV